MEILHVAAECFPMAKAGGLGDVVGALPKYQCQLGHTAKVVIPMHRTPFLYKHEWELVHEGGAHLGPQFFHYSIIKEKSNFLGFDLYLVDINGLLDREKVYGYDDDSERYIAFQIAVCDWVNKWIHPPSVIHCHDHHAGFVPFLMNYGFDFRHRLSKIPTVFTVHNAQYPGAFGWNKNYLLPAYDSWKWNMLDWNGLINPLAAAVKCAWKVTTVSASYMEELQVSAAGLENLFAQEKSKSVGILNGIDNQIWDPSNDSYLLHHYDESTLEKGKRANKEEICRHFNLDPDPPLCCFVGRLVGEKAADLLPDAIADVVYHNQGRINFVVLGSGDPAIESRLQQLKDSIPNSYGVYIGYEEALSHLLYAGSDFLLMPSRVEPCGLNQLYALRYGTLPIVRNVGGLRDTVIDMGDQGGFGIRFEQATQWDISYSLSRAIDLYYNEPKKLLMLQRTMMTIDHSWNRAAQQYLDLYSNLK
jgi:starch synthase